MEVVDASISNFAAALPGNTEPDTAETEGFSRRVDEIFQLVDKIVELTQERANEIEPVYLNSSNKQASNSKGSSVMKDKGKERHVLSIRKQQQEASRREKAAEKRIE